MSDIGYTPQGLAGHYGYTARSPLDLLTAKEAWGVRHNTNQPKGEGWLGNIGTEEMPVTEYTINTGGRELPTAVPTLTPEEAKQLGAAAIKHERVPEEVIRKAIEFANNRNRQGLSQFKD